MAVSHVAGRLNPNMAHRTRGKWRTALEIIGHIVLVIGIGLAGIALVILHAAPHEAATVLSYFAGAVVVVGCGVGLVWLSDWHIKKVK